MNSLILGLLAEDVRVRLTEFCLIEAVTEFLASLSDLFLDFLLDFAEIILDKVIGTISLLGILIIYKRVIESSHMS